MIIFYVGMAVIALVLLFGDRIGFLKGFRTLLLQGLVGLVGVLEVTDWAPIFGDPQKVGIAMLVISGVGVLARLKTTSRVGGKP